MKNNFLIMTGTACFLLSAPVFAAQGKAVITGTSADSKVAGEVDLTEEKDGLMVMVNVTGAPAGKHGIHFHENGSCADGGKAAGGHFNPDNVMHGFMPKDGLMHAHVGDMGNIDVGEDGKGSLHIVLPGVTLEQGKYAVKGKSVILHEKADDFSQPTGNAGARIGCGIIEEAKQ